MIQDSSRPDQTTSRNEPIGREQFGRIIAEERQKIDIRRKNIKDDTVLSSTHAAAAPSDSDLVGLALSGGGIRSATFNLGVLQRLADLKILPLVDYLSTVSGGGYIGGWWSSWMCRGDNPGSCMPPKPADSVEPSQIKHLRLYSNYIIPRKGLFSPDTWRAVTVVLRNLIVTQVVIASFMAAVFLLIDLPYLFLVPEMIRLEDIGFWVRFKSIGLYVLIVFAAIWYIVTITFLLRAAGDSERIQRLRTKITQFHAFCAATLSVTAGLLMAAGFSDLLLSWLNRWVGHKGGWLAVLPGIASSIYAAIAKAPAGGGDALDRRESRVKKYLLKAAPVLSLFTLTALLCSGVWWLLRWAHFFLAEMPEQHWILALSLAVVFVASQFILLYSLFAWRSGPSASDERDPHYAFLIGTSLFSLAISLILYLTYAGHHAAPWWAWAACFWIVTHVAIASGFACDPNALSLHGFYASRLRRAYLGATNSQRIRAFNQDRDRISGHQNRDDMALCKVSSWDKGGPIHILNTTLNLVGAKDLTSKQRQSEIFELTPLHCGSDSTAYRPTDGYAGGELTLGTAMAVSGAAASTNMGCNTSVAMAMLMSFFNVRLGYWIANPALASWRRPWTRLWLWYQLREMFGQTTAQGRFSFLSDGGHSENLGLYSLVKRRCRYIIVSDAGADSGYTFDDLARAIRMLRIDQQCDVKLDLKELHPVSDDQSLFRHSRLHYAVGDIKYSDGHPDSILIYLKSSLADNLPVDIQGYARANPLFPHQTTADQFFDEAQFESYRCLGYNVAGAAFGGITIPQGKTQNRENFFNAVKARFVAPPAMAPAAAAQGSQNVP